jgi:peptidyl-prolyl cis-trans isomerase SurA
MSREATIALFCSLCVFGAPLCLAEPAQPSHEVIVLDAIVATVDDKPITLSELNARLGRPRRLTLEEASRDQQASKVLDGMILERLLELEATSKKVSISDEELDEYINEVAARNSLTRQEFESELKKQGQSIDSYRQQIKLDILRTKLSSSMMRNRVSVSEQEVDTYIDEHPELKQPTTSLNLSVITISSQGRNEQQMETKVAEVLSALEAGDTFAEVAQRFSDGPNTAEGGSLGLVVEQDLSAEILNAISSLDEGSYSKPLVSQVGVQIFFVAKRFSALDDDDQEARLEAIRSEIKELLQKGKSHERLSSYFTTDLYKNHSVDKKI